MTLEELEKIPWCFLSDEEAKERARLHEAARRKPKKEKPDTRKVPVRIVGEGYRQKQEPDEVRFLPTT